MNPTQPTPTIETNVVKKPSLWPTLMWLHYLLILFPIISSFFILLSVKATNPTDTLASGGVSVSINQTLIMSGIQILIYLILLAMCLKRNRSTLKVLPILEVILYIAFAISTVLIFKLNNLNMNQLISPLLLNLIRPAIVIFVLFKNKDSYIK